MAEADFQANGNNYIEGPTCLLRTMCLKREPCTTCTADVDCNDPDMRCARTPADQAQVCATLCNPANEGDCPLDEQCDVNALVTPIAASARACRASPVQGHRRLLRPVRRRPRLRRDRVCPGLGHGGRVPLNYPPTDTCTTNADARVGHRREGPCLDEDWGFAQGSSFYHKCFLPSTTPRSPARPAAICLDGGLRRLDGGLRRLDGGLTEA